MKTVFLLAVCAAASLLCFAPIAERRALSESSDAKAAPAAVEDDMHEFMEYVFQPPYKRLRAGLAKQPADRAAWKQVKSDSLILAESANLLLSRAPDKDGEDWLQHSVTVRKAGGGLYRAAKKGDYTATRAAFASMLQKCNSCHKQFEDGKHILKP